MQATNKHGLLQRLRFAPDSPRLPSFAMRVYRHDAHHRQRRCVAPLGILREGNPEGRLHTRRLRWDEAQWDEGSWVRYLVLLVFPRDADERREGHPPVFCPVRQSIVRRAGFVREPQLPQDSPAPRPVLLLLTGSSLRLQPHSGGPLSRRLVYCGTASVQHKTVHRACGREAEAAGHCAERDRKQKSSRHHDDFYAWAGSLGLVDYDVWASS